MRPLSPVATPNLPIASAILVAVATLFALSVSTPQCCQAQQGPQWIHFDEYPDGTPATIELMEDDSSSQVTRFIVTIHGFWIEPVMGPDQRWYNRYEFPGLGMINEEGAPELPKLVLRVAVPTTAQELTLYSAVILGDRYYENVLPYPTPDHGVEDTAEEWRYDQKIYDGQQRYPLDYAPQTAPMERVLNQIPSGDLEIFPVQWNPQTRELHIIKVLDIAYDHAGPIRNMEPMTRHRMRLAGSLFDNWPAVEEEFPQNTTRYLGEYLFIYQAAYALAVRPLANQKRARGFHVTELYLEDIGSTDLEIESAMGDWIDGVPVEADAYALLIGDHAELPMYEVLDEGGVPLYTDDRYGYPGSNNLSEKIFVGRLSIDGVVDLTQQITKILEYEDTGSYMGDYSEALLVAHHQDAPGRYERNCEVIRTGFYNHPPTFLTCYGSNGGTNADIEQAIEEQVGVVCYRGHGSPDGWTHWNPLDETYSRDDLLDLDNALVTPVVWSLTCISGAMNLEDCFTEKLMMDSQSRAVAVYGATLNTAFSVNNVIGKTLFQRVYRSDIVIHSHAIMAAEEQSAMEIANRESYLYYLLGDPEMHIRRRAPADLVLMAPETVPLCGEPPCWLDAQVMDDQGQPLPEMIVSAWMPSPPGKQPPAGGVFSNLYSDVEGKVHLPADPGGEGWILLTARDDFGRVISDSVRVVTGTATPAGLAPLVLSPRPAVMTEQTTFHFGRALDSAFRMEVYDQRGRLVRRMQGERGLDRLLWDGRDTGGQKVGSGVYLVRLIAEQRRLSTKVVRVR